MKEEASKSLMELFAIAASLTERQFLYRSRTIVESYSKSFLPSTEKSDTLLHYAHSLKDYNDSSPKNQQVILQRAKKLCFELSNELASKERIIVLLHLLDIMVIDERFTTDEENLIEVIAREFKFADSETNDLVRLVQIKDNSLIPEAYFVFVEDSLSLESEDLEGSWIEKHKPREKENEQIIQKPGFKNKLFFYYLSGIHAFAFKISSTDNVHLNGREVLPGRLYLMETEDNLSGNKIGSIPFSLLLDSVQRFDFRGKISLAIRKLSYSYIKGQQIIKPFSVYAESGKMICIIGEKNAGKSTLIQILSGEIKDYHGSVTLNGYELKLDWFRLRNIIGHVPKKDIIINELSVYDNLYYNAKLCFASLPEKEIEEKLNKLLDLLDLQEIKHRITGNSKLTAFVRKKINIGLELLKDPQILVLDEPLASLSSSEAESIARLLKILAVGGKLIILSINHTSPRAFRLVNDVWVLDDEGYTIYSGPVNEALTYFNSENPTVSAVDAECENCGM